MASSCRDALGHKNFLQFEIAAQKYTCECYLNHKRDEASRVCRDGGAGHTRYDITRSRLNLN